MIVATLTNNGHKFWMRSTTWAFHVDRATTFATVEEAKAHFETKAKQFTQPKLRKLVRYEEVTQADIDASASAYAK